MPQLLTPLELQSAIIRDPLRVSSDTTVIDAIAQMSGLPAGCDGLGKSPCPSKPTTVQGTDDRPRAPSSCVLVVEARQVIGILTERDVVRLSAQPRLLDCLMIREVMAHPVITLCESGFTDVDAAVTLLQQHQIRHLPILDDHGCLTGLVTYASLHQAHTHSHLPAELGKRSPPEARLRESKPSDLRADHSNCNQAEAKAKAEGLPAEGVRLELKVLEHILDNILAGYWDWDIPNHQEYLSPGFKQMFGYADHELPNSPDSWQNLIFPEDLAKVLVCFDRHVQSRGKIPFYNEVRYRHRDGSTVWVICTGQTIEWDTEGNPVRMIGCHIDISDRKRAEAALIRSEAQLKHLVSYSPVVIFSCQPHGDYRATFISDNVEALLGWKAQDFLADSEFWVNHLHPEDAEGGLAGLASLFTDDFYAHEYRLRKGDDTYCWCFAQLRLMRDEAGNPLEMLGYLIDISDRKQSEKHLRQVSTRLDLAVKLVD